jgi:hypothetical protein
VLVVAGLAAVAAGFFASQEGGLPPVAFLGSLGVFAGLGAVLVGVQHVLAAGRDRAASVGEGPVVSQLRARLGDEYTYLRRVTIPHRGAEADGILLGPSGALVLAIRALEGRYVVRGNDWYTVRNDGVERPLGRSPTWEVARPVRALQRAIQEEGLPKVAVQGAVVLAEGILEEASRPGTAVVPLDRFGAFVDYLRQGEASDVEAVRLLTAFLEPFAGGRDSGEDL